MQPSITKGEIIDRDHQVIDLNLRYLEIELARIDLLIRREVRRWQLAGQDPTDSFRGLYVTDQNADALLERPVGTNWGRTVALSSDEDRDYEEALTRVRSEANAVASQAEEMGQALRLVQLASTFELDAFEYDALLICLAPALDLRYERVFGYLQDDVTRKRPSINLVLDFLSPPGIQRLTYLNHFTPGSPLIKHQLLERVPDSNKLPLLGQPLHPDDGLVAWLLGNYQPQTDLGDHAALIEPVESSTDSLMVAEVWPSIAAILSHEPLLIFYGLDQSNQEACARRVAAQVNKPLLFVDLASLQQEGLPPARSVELSLRDARLVGAVPFLRGWDSIVGDSGTPPLDALEELYRFPGCTIVCSRDSWRAQGVTRDRPLFWIEFPIPEYPQRKALWGHFLNAIQVDGAVDIPSLAGQFLLTTGQIRDACATARDLATQRGSQVLNQDLFASARAHSNPNLSSLARKILPRYGWQDIVLPGDQLSILHEIVGTVRGRPVVLDEWGVGAKLASSRGVTVLFAGPPGTGKTMAAEVISSELGLDLYKIDLSTVVSKYIGETEKNLERIFHEAETSNAILFFDEADSLFGKRSEVRDSHDRYANIEISYLLQRMEAYDGVTILATNLRANLDEAFKRRLQFAVDFPFPEEADRLRIWETLFPPGVPRDTSIDMAFLARRFKLAGGNIRNIIVSAAYLAASDGGVVTMSHILHGARREMQKMGRLVGEDDLFRGQG